MFEKNEFESLMLDSPEVQMTDEEVIKNEESLLERKNIYWCHSNKGRKEDGQ